MWTIITGFFSSAKNIIMSIGAVLVSAYVAKQKYNAYRAETKLKDIENKIDKANVAVVKEVAKTKAEAKEVEHSSEVETLRVLKEENKKVLKEMDKIEKTIVETQSEKVPVEPTRKRSKKIKVDV